MILSFSKPEEFRKWLKENHDISDGIWIRIFKKSSERTSITYAEALDEAICYGWIDGQKKPHDAESWLQKFCRRRPKSGWSKINTGHGERLMRTGRMRAAGRKEIEAAKKDGRWNAAYDSPSQSTMPEDFLEALAKDPKAHAFFDGLNKANRYAISYRLQTAKKPETRQRRMEMILTMLSRGEAFH